MADRAWRHISTALLALIVGVLIWVNATYQNDRPREDVFGQPIPIERLNVPEGMVVTNQPASQVRVRIKTFASTWEELSVGDFTATSDWEGLKEGTYTVPVSIECEDRTVSILSVEPSEITVQLEPLLSEARPVIIEVEGEDELPLGYSVSPPIVSPDQLSVSGPASAVERVSHLEASVGVSDQRESVEAEVEPVAVDSEGLPVSNVSLLPPSVQVTVAIEKQQNFREVAVRVRTTGQPERGYYVSGVNVLPSTVTLVGPAATISEMGSLVEGLEAVDVTGATRMLAEKVALALPEGVSVYGSRADQPYEVLVTIDIDAVSGGTTVQLPLQVHHLGEGLQIAKLTDNVDVILTGPSILLDELQTDLVEAYVDLSGLSAGTHQVEPQVEIMLSSNPELRELTIKDVLPEFVDVVIEAIPTPTPTPTITPTPTLTPTTTPTLRPTVAPTATPLGAQAR